MLGCWVGEPPIEQCQEKVLMMVGATGAGKTTLINGMVNYILDVQWKNNFRFKLITEKKKTQTKSQTTSITAYTLHKMEGCRITYTLTIIDTPRFGDTKPISHSATSSSLTTPHCSLQPSMKRTTLMKCSGRWVLHLSRNFFMNLSEQSVLVCF